MLQTGVKIQGKKKKKWTIALYSDGIQWLYYNGGSGLVGGLFLEENAVIHRVQMGTEWFDENDGESFAVAYLVIRS